MAVRVTGINPITIQLGRSSLDKVGDTLTAYSTVNPTNATNKVINWTSSDTRYISLTNHATLLYFGQIAAVGLGAADIIATSSDGGFIARYVNFYVGLVAPVFVSGINPITATGGATSMAINSTLTLSSSVTPANAANTRITWSSSNTSIATVGLLTGIVTATGNGDVVITAKTANGGYPATYNLHVSGGPVASVAITAPVLYFNPSQTSTFTASVTPYDATDTSVTWESSAPLIASVDSSTGIVTALQDGNATITARSVSTTSVSNSVGIIVSSSFVPCFPAGVKIATSAGHKAVEDIEESDTLLTADGRSVSFKKHTTLVPYSTKESAPYTIPADTIMKGIPSAELRLSPWHAFMVGPNAWQKPAIASLYYKNITQDKEGERVVYYHFETSNYLGDNFVVAGTIVESFANDQLKGANPYTYHVDKSYFTRANTAK